MACPAPHRHDGVHERAAGDGRPAGRPPGAAIRRLSRNLAQRQAGARPQTASLHGAEAEPLYGKVYLPRKFKTGLALPEDNCIDVYAQDLGLLAIVENGRIAGYNVLVGGGMGMTHGNANTFPLPGQADLLCAGRRRGRRRPRRSSSCSATTATAPTASAPASSTWSTTGAWSGSARCWPATSAARSTCRGRSRSRGFDPHLGWHPQGDGKWFYGLSVENGRVKDEGTLRLRSGLRTIVRALPARNCA